MMTPAKSRASVLPKLIDVMIDLCAQLESLKMEHVPGSVDLCCYISYHHFRIDKDCHDLNRFGMKLCSNFVEIADMLLEEEVQ